MSSRRADCVLCLDPLGPGDSTSLGCGHILHQSCVEQLLALDGDRRRCPLCREAIDPDRLRAPALVAGAKAGSGYAAYAPRSAAPLRIVEDTGMPDPRPYRRRLPVAAFQAAVWQAPEMVGGVDPRAALVEHLSAQIPAQEALGGAAAAGNSFCIAIDVSGSMLGLGLDEWTATNSSRLATAVTMAAAYVARVLRPNDSLCVFAFDDAVTPILEWAAKGEEFDTFDFMNRCARAIESLERGGTHLYAAVQAACAALDARAEAGGGGGESNLLLVTDGEAQDADAFAAAHAAISDPRHPLRALLLKIDVEAWRDGSGPKLRDLARARSGAALSHVSYREVPVPGMLGSDEGRLQRLSAAMGSLHQTPLSPGHRRRR